MAETKQGEYVNHEPHDNTGSKPTNFTPPAYLSPPSHLSPEAEQYMPIPFESLDFSFDQSFLEVDNLYDPTFGGTRQPTGSSIIEPDAYLDRDGRTYHSYTQGSLYFLPNDGIEQDRLDLQHSIFSLMLEGKLALAPINSPRHVLDIATGTGIWAIDFAEQNPDSQVVGTDLSLIQPTSQLPNCQFIREDVEASDWLFPNLFDYVHLRNIVWCFDNTKLVFQRSFDYMTPGAWIEIQDPTPQPYFLNGSFEGSAVDQLFSLLRSGLAKLGRFGSRGPLYQSWLTEIGFVDVEERIIPTPCGGWPKDPRMKKIGLWQRENFLEMMDGVRKLAMASGATEDDVKSIIEGCRRQLDHPNSGFIVNYYFVYARKPLNGEVAKDTHQVEMK